MLFFNGTWFFSNDFTTAMLCDFWAARPSNDSTFNEEFSSVSCPESDSPTETFCFPDLALEFLGLAVGEDDRLADG
jgi:hypothetical protein